MDTGNEKSQQPGPKVLAILQARVSSRRLPGKVLADLSGKPMILQQIARVKGSQLIERLVVATSTDSSDDALCDLLKSEGVKVYRGSLENVVRRFAIVIRTERPLNIVRLTADCPLTDWELIDFVISSHLASSDDYTSNTMMRSYPKGLDVEIFRVEAFQRLCQLPLSGEEKEHVTVGFHNKSEVFSLGSVSQAKDESHFRWTVDYPEDLLFVRRVYDFFSSSGVNFTTADIRALVDEFTGNFR